MGLHKMWRLFCELKIGYNTNIIESAIATYNVVEMTSVINGCTIELTREAIAEVLEVPMEAESKGQTIDKEELRAINKAKFTN